MNSEGDGGKPALNTSRIVTQAGSFDLTLHRSCSRKRQLPLMTWDTGSGETAAVPHRTGILWNPSARPYTIPISADCPRLALRDHIGCGVDTRFAGLRTCFHLSVSMASFRRLTSEFSMSTEHTHRCFELDGSMRCILIVRGLCGREPASRHAFATPLAAPRAAINVRVHA